MFVSKIEHILEAFVESHCTYTFPKSPYIQPPLPSLCLLHVFFRNVLSPNSSSFHSHIVPSFHSHIEANMSKASYPAVIGIAIVCKHAKF